MDQPGTIDNPANRENDNIPVSVRGRELDLARRVRPSRPASACSFSILRLNLVLIHGIPLAFHDSVHIYIYIYIYHQPPSVQSRVYQVTPLRTDGVHCRESAGTGPVTGGAAFSGFTMDQLVCASLSSHPRSSGGCGAGLTLKRCSQLVAFAIQSCSFSILRLNLVLIHGIPLAFHDSVHIYIYIYIPSTAIGSIPSVSGHSIAYRWRSLSRVRRHRASNGWCCLFRLHHGPTCMRLSFLTPQVFRRVWGRAHPQEMQPTGCLCDSIIQPAG